MEPPVWERVEEGENAKGISPPPQPVLLHLLVLELPKRHPGIQARQQGWKPQQGSYRVFLLKPFFTS